MPGRGEGAPRPVPCATASIQAFPFSTPHARRVCLLVSFQLRWRSNAFFARRLSARDVPGCWAFAIRFCSAALPDKCFLRFSGASGGLPLGFGAGFGFGVGFGLCTGFAGFREGFGECFGEGFGEGFVTGLGTGLDSGVGGWHFPGNVRLARCARASASFLHFSRMPTSLHSAKSTSAGARGKVPCCAALSGSVVKS